MSLLTPEVPLSLQAGRRRRTLRTGACALLAALGLAAVLAGCGGGTDQVEPFNPDRLVVFGDEISLLLPGGRKYSVNVLKADGSLDCAQEPIWTQELAANYGFVFAECNPNASTELKAVMRATVGAKAEDLAAQVDAAVAAGDLQGTVLTTVLVGSHDVLEVYAQYTGSNEGDLSAELRTRGALAAAQVNRLVSLGARVMVSTAPNLGFSPFALKELAKDPFLPQLLTNLTAAFNTGLRCGPTPGFCNEGFLNDGRRVGLLLADDATQAMYNDPIAYGLTNASIPVCTVPLPLCTSSTLVAGTNSTNYLWADDTRPAYGGHRVFGSTARSRVNSLPF